MSAGSRLRALAATCTPLVLGLGALSSVNIALAFLFQWYVLTRLGAGTETDALFAGMTIPQLVLAVISGSLTHVLVPLLSGERPDEARRDAWGFLALVGGLFGALAVALWFAAPWWVPLTVPGFTAAGQELTVRLTRIQLIGMVFTALNGVQWAAYHARQRFIWAELSAVLTNLAGLLLMAWALPIFGVVAVAWIGTARFVAQAVLLAPGMGAPAWPDLRRPALALAWRRIAPLLLGTTYYKTDPAVDRYLLSSANSGSISLYYLAQQIYSAVSQVLGKALAAPFVPAVSRLHKTGDREGFRSAYARAVWQVLAVSVAALVPLVVVGEPLLSLVLGHGHITSKNVNGLWWMLLWLGGAFLGGNLGQITSSAFYAVGDTRTPTRLSITSYTVYLPVKVMAFHVLGVAGLALATSAYYLINLLLQHRLLRTGHLAPR